MKRERTGRVRFPLDERVINADCYKNLRPDMSQATLQPSLAELKYRVVKELGTGAGSTILLVSDNSSGKKYALKVVKRQSADDDVYIAQARIEFDVSQRLHHDSILKIYDMKIKRSWFRINGVELLMEYVDGRTLDEAPYPDMKRLLLIFVKVAEALAHMHRRGVYHGDLKPSNIMFAKNGAVKVIDFGTAWIKGENKNRVQGTPQYMAPEQAIEKVVNERTDLYNLGATMYRMFTGKYANSGIPTVGIRGIDESRILMKSPIELNPRIPGTLNETILACLQLSPDRRPAGMFEVQNQLKAVAKYAGLKESDLKGLDVDQE
jgi:serine/threonine-protein kinase